MPPLTPGTTSAAPIQNPLAAVSANADGESLDFGVDMTVGNQGVCGWLDTLFRVVFAAEFMHGGDEGAGLGGGAGQQLRGELKYAHEFELVIGLSDNDDPQES